MHFSSPTMDFSGLKENAEQYKIDYIYTTQTFNRNNHEITILLISKIHPYKQNPVYLSNYITKHKQNKSASTVQLKSISLVIALSLNTVDLDVMPETASQNSKSAN